MKIIKTTDIIAGQAMPFKGGSLQWLQDAYKDTFTSMIYGMDFLSTITPTAIFGCGAVNTAGSTWAIAEGAIFYLGEIYYVPAATVVLGGGEVLICNITQTSQSGASYDPVIFSNGASFNVHIYRKIEVTNGASGSGTFNFSTLRVLGEPRAVTYSAGYLTATAGTWTVAGAGSFSVRVYYFGRRITVDFAISSWTTSGAPDGLLLQVYPEVIISYIDTTGKAVYNVTAVGNYTNGATTEPLRITATAASNQLTLSRFGTAFPITAGTGNVSGQITYLLD